MKNVVEKFLKYVKYDTTANNHTNKTPSTIGQMIFAKELVKELQELKLCDISLDDKGFIMATLESNIEQEVPTIGFIAHMDTSPDFTGKDVKPQIINNYNGKDIILNSELKVVLSPKEFPELNDYIGETIITTDGTTLLGADDKAGIAEIMTAIEYLVNNPHIPHGRIRIAFTPDEELDNSAVDIFDVEKFGVDLAYTIDGDGIGEFNYENFNAAGARISINGRSVHPGEAKDKMVNSLLLANEFINRFPRLETPEHTQGYEGFYYLESMSGDVEKTSMEYLIRDFDKIEFENRKNFILSLVDEFNDIYGSGTVEMELNDDYYNMRDTILSKRHIIDVGIKAIEEVGIKPSIRPIRGGTDGAGLALKGLCAPNIFLGGHNYHGRYEFIPVIAMEKATEVILKIIEIYTHI